MLLPECTLLSTRKLPRVDRAVALLSSRADSSLSCHEFANRTMRLCEDKVRLWPCGFVSRSLSTIAKCDKTGKIWHTFPSLGILALDMRDIGIGVDRSPLPPRPHGTRSKAVDTGKV